MIGNQQLYFGVDDGETFAVDKDTFTDDGTAIAVRIRTKEYYLSNPDILDEIQRIFVYADEPQGINLSLSTDSDDYQYLGQTQKVATPQRFEVWKKGYHFSLGFDEVSSYNLQIKGFNIHYESQPEIR